jgi:Zn-dependent protease with chaperone function
MLFCDGQARPVAIRSVSQRIGALPRRLSLSDGSTFECADGSAVDAFLDGHEQQGGFVAWLERSWKIAAVATVLVAVLLTVLVRYGLPAAAMAAARSTPVVYLDTIDAGTMATADRTLLWPSVLPPERQQKLRAIFQELAGHSDGLRQPVQLEFRGSVMGPNAFALPGGTVVLLDALVALAKNDDEIAGVLAHEIGHIAHDHTMQSIYRALGIVAIASSVSGDGGQLIEHVVTQLSTLQSLSYSREFETDADRYSVIVMRRAGRDPLAFIDLLDRLVQSRQDTKGKKDKPPSETSWWSSHPGNADRREEVEAMMREPLPPRD